MAYGKNGATCWLADAIRTLQKRVEWLEVRAQHAAAPAPVVEHILQAPAGYTTRARHGVHVTRIIGVCRASS